MIPGWTGSRVDTEYAVAHWGQLRRDRLTCSIDSVRLSFLTNSFVTAPSLCSSRSIPRRRFHYFAKGHFTIGVHSRWGHLVAALPLWVPSRLAVLGCGSAALRLLTGRAAAD